MPTPFTNPYDAILDDAGYAWTGGMSNDRIVRVHVESGETTPDLHKGDVITREIGTLEVPAGRHELSVDAVEIPAGGELARFIGVTLTPIT